MKKYQIIKLCDEPECKDMFARGFHQQWGIPLAAYLKSMNACIGEQSPVPQWYGVIEQGKLIAGLGVIENDFHGRKDLTPNVCAVFVEETYRCQGIAGEMLHFVCRDMKQRGIDTLYLLTDHTAFYERYGWEFLCMVQGDGETELSRIYMHQEA